MFRLLFLGLFIWIGYWFWYDPQVVHPPGILIPEQPYQEEVQMEKWTKGNYTVEALRLFQMRGRVLSKSWYFHDREAELSEYDLALGWQEMSDSKVLERMEFAQSGRWYYYDWLQPATLLQEDVTMKSANMHIIAANKEVLDALNEIIRGDIIDMQGYLVRVTDDKGWRWTSSVVRTDTGTSSCEVVWVEKLKILLRPGS